MRTRIRVLNLYMNEKLVGRLEKKSDGAICFRYVKEWLHLPGARPISLSLPLIEKEFSGDIVYNFFDNLLPDNSQIRARIQARFHTMTDQPFDLLASIGRDCIGAIQMLGDDLPDSIQKILAQPLNNQEIALSLRQVKFYPLGMSDDCDDFRISIAGAQEKSAFLFWNNQWSRPLGATPTTHIFKLPIGFIQHQQLDLSDSCENEWLCAQIAAAFDLPVATCVIQKFEDEKVLIVERFDRRLAKNKQWMMRLPQEDVCQALGVSPNLKYQVDGGPGIKEIMRLLLGSTTPSKDRDTFFRSQVLFWLLAAIDGHAKNFSIHLEAFGKYHLAPLYDIISAYPLIANKQLEAKKIKMAMALQGKNNHYHWYQLQRRYFLQTAKAAHYPVEDAEKILDDMLNQVDTVIHDVNKRLPNDFPAHISQPIFDGMRSVKQKLVSNVDPNA
ncbi:MAG: type II toxin-antitoxin system HipA family toxin [Gammaproteobacteria bacterium]|nr:type II toxin-antitoxin system HipA family toxin [Gammaproteobacteria bacterium]